MLTEPKINQTNVTEIVEHDITGFQVAIGDSQPMEVQNR
jgi:hypothetical protein